MSNELTTVATITTVAKNIHDIHNGFSGIRQRRIISSGQEEHIRQQVRCALTREHGKMRHELACQERQQIIDSWHEIEDYMDSSIGVYLAASIEREARAYKDSIDDFDRFTRSGGFR